MAEDVPECEEVGGVEGLFSGGHFADHFQERALSVTGREPELTLLTSGSPDNQRGAN